LKHPKIDPSVSENRALAIAAEYDRPKVVQTLLGDQRVNPNDQSKRALNIAIESGHVTVVELLLGDKRMTFDDVGQATVAAMETAVSKGHKEVTPVRSDM
jgi:hypothetical protein